MIELREVGSDEEGKEDKYGVKKAYGTKKLPLSPFFLILAGIIIYFKNKV